MAICGGDLYCSLNLWFVWSSFRSKPTGKIRESKLTKHCYPPSESKFTSCAPAVKQTSTLPSPFSVFALGELKVNMPGLVCSGCRNEVPQTGQLQHGVLRVLSLEFLENGRLRLMGWAPLSAAGRTCSIPLLSVWCAGVFLACDLHSLISVFIFTRHFPCVYVSASKVILYKAHPNDFIVTNYIC